MNISQDDLPSFLTLAEELQIRGLANQNETNSATKQIRTRILDAASKSIMSTTAIKTDTLEVAASSQHNTSSTSPPPLKKARPTTTTPAGQAKDSDSSVSFGTLLQTTIDPVDSSPEVMLDQSEDEFEDDERNVASNEAYEEEDKDCSFVRTISSKLLTRSTRQVFMSDFLKTFWK